MTTLERELVRSFNIFFEENSIRGIAYRIKQHKFSTQFLDILVDSLDPDYYLGIECKSISVEKGAASLYFSQHFSRNKNGEHQIGRISKFLEKSGRKGLLIAELREGSGKPRQAYAIKWQVIEEIFRENKPGLRIEEIKQFPKLLRIKGRYHIDKSIWK
ncbi:MAG: hypothetical protein QXL78_02385 [Methanocellales archaeon]